MGTNVANERPAKGNCPTCFKEADLFMCSRCEDIFYCSRQCQTADWPIHKLLCEKLSRYQQRPRADHIRAIVFPAERACAPAEMQRPRFAWIKKLGQDQWDFSHYFEKTAELQEYTLDMSGQTKPIATQKMFIAQSCPWMTLPVPNKSIQNLGAPGVCYQWIGDIVIVGADGDLNMRDFRAVVDWFQCYEYNKALLDPSRFVGHTYTGVKAYCKGDMDRYKAPELQQVQITPSIAMRLGLRSLGYFDKVISLACTNPDPHALGMPPTCNYYHFNKNSLMLMLDSVFFTDYNYLKNWLEKPALPTGSLIFLRVDMTPLQIQEFRDMQDFLREQVKNHASPIDEKKEKALAASLTWEKWREFLAHRQATADLD